MNLLKRLLARTSAFVEAIGGIDDPAGEYTNLLGERLGKLEHRLQQLDNRPEMQGSAYLPHKD